MAELEGLERRVLRSSFWRVLTQRVTLPWILRFADLPERASVLEVGSGGGFNAEVFAHRFPGWTLTVSDYDSEMVGLCRHRLARFLNIVDFRQADATRLPFDDDSSDVVISIFVWHHVEDWRRATAECARVLRPGGRLVLVDLLGAIFPSPIARLFPPMSRYGLGDVRRAIRAAGFARWRTNAIGGLVYRMVAEKPEASEKTAHSAELTAAAK